MNAAKLFTDFGFALLYVVIIDLAMIMLIMRKRFGKMILSIQREPMRLRIIPAILCYLVLAFGIAYFVMPNIRDDHVAEDAARWGLVWGVMVYAVYDLTNLATLSNYEVKTACIDVIWGGVLGFMTVLCTQYTVKNIKI